MQPNQQEVQATEALVPYSKFLELNISGTARQVRHYGSNSSNLAGEHEAENEVLESQATPVKVGQRTGGHADDLASYRYTTPEEGYNIPL